MGNALISRRGGGGYGTVKFDNYGTLPLPTRSTPTELSQARDPVATTSGSYALFGGGLSSTSVPYFYSDVVDIYSDSLVKGTATSLSIARGSLAATTVGGYALFGGGYNNSGYSNVVDAYNSSLTRSTPTSLSTARQTLAATTVGDYALFGGGYNGSSSPNQSNVVDAYNSSLTRSTPTELSESKHLLAATTVGNYALFGGGYKYTSSSYSIDKCSSVVNSYNTSLTRSTPTALSEARYKLAATTVRDYALFGGGYNASSSTNDYSNVVDAYNSSLTRSTPTELSVARERIGAASVGGYALFGGGYRYVSSTRYYYSNVDAYNISLSRITATSLSKERCPAATTVGNYAIFGGGDINSDTAPQAKCSTVDAYKGNASDLNLTVYKYSKYKFQNMSSETTVSSDVETISIPIPATGYIKFKNTTIS